MISGTPSPPGRTGTSDATAVSPRPPFDGWPSVLGRLADGQDLDRAGARAAADEMLGGRATDAQIAGWMVALRLKGETTDELLGLVDSALDHATRIDLAPGAIDIVGTGGSPSRRRHALNVSTMASFVAAAAGARVCKHGNVRASSTSGSFDLLAALGVEVDLDPAGVIACVDAAGVGFVFARRYHPAMRHVGPVRAQLGIPTVFNVLGPLANPAGVRHHVVGVSDPRLSDRIVDVLERRGAERAWVVHGHGALDELALDGPSEVVELHDGERRRFVVAPEEVGVAVGDAEALAGGDPQRNAELAQEVFDGAQGPVTEIVALNAGAALVVAGVADDLTAGVLAARRAIDSGAATGALDAVRATSHAHRSLS